ncbi:glycosyltransferase, partial [Proteus mirabilis]
MSIEIAISTLNDGIFNIKLRHDFNYLIVHQITNNKDYSSYINNIYNENVRYISSNEVGLSKSRNLAIKNSHSDYIWIMDDDVIILDGTQEKINKLISEKQNCDMFILNHKPVKGNKTTYINEYSAMSVSSINMLIK